LPQVRRNLWLAIVFVIAFSGLTHLVLDEAVNRTLDLIASVMFTPILLIGLVVVYSPLYQRLYPLVSQVGAPTFGIGVTVLAVIAASHGVSLIATVVLVSIYIFFMLGMTFYSALGSSLLVFASYFISAAAYGLAAVGAGDRRRRADLHQRDRRDGLLHAGARDAHQLPRRAAADRDREPRRPDRHPQPPAVRRARRPHLAAGDSATAHRWGCC
jgi:hypothetical protein